MNQTIRRFLQDEGGATAIEYGLIVALIAIAIVTGVGSFADGLSGLWNGNEGKITEAMSSR